MDICHNFIKPQTAIYTDVANEDARSEVKDHDVARRTTGNALTQERHDQYGAFM